MTSEIRANTLKNRVGLGTVSFTNTGPVVSGIVTANELDVTDDLTIGGEFNMIGSSDSNKYIDARIGSSNTLVFRSASGGGGNLVTMLQLGTGASSLVGNLTLADSSDSSSAAGPEFTLNRNSSSPANADYLGQIKFAGRSSTGVQRNYAKITGKILDVTNGSEDGILEFSHIRNGSQAITGRWRSDSLQLLNDTNLSVAGDTTLTSDLDVDGHTNLDNVSIAGVTTTSDNIKIEADNKYLSIGAHSGGDLLAYHDGNKSVLVNYTGDFHLRTNNGSRSSLEGIILKPNGATEIYHSGSKIIETDSLGINVLGRLDVSGTGANDHLNLDSNTTRLRIGGYADLQLFHDSTNINYISNHNDIDLHIVSTYGGSPVKTQAKFIHNAAVELYYNDVKTFETTNEGAKLDTNTSSTILRLNSNTDAESMLQAVGSDLFIKAPSSGSIYMVGNGNEVKLSIYSNGKLATNGAASVDCGIGGLHLYLGDGARNDYSTAADGLIIEKNGNTGLSIDPGSSGTANIYFPNESNHSIAQISHNNSNGEFRIRGEDHVILSTNGNVERMRIDSSGRVVVGGSSAYVGGAALAVLGTGTTPNTYGSFAIGKVGANPTAGTTLANIRLNGGSIGTRRGAEINATAASNWTDGSSHPTNLIFAVAKDGSASVTDRVLISQYGHFQVTNENALPSGSTVGGTNGFKGLSQHGYQHWGQRQYYSGAQNLSQNQYFDLFQNNVNHDDIIFWLNIKGYHSNRTFATAHGTIGGYGISVHYQGATGVYGNFSGVDVAGYGGARRKLRWTSTSPNNAIWWIWGWFSGTAYTSTLTGWAAGQLH